jgi:putative flavoprotein involved in K+ transport
MEGFLGRHLLSHLVLGFAFHRLMTVRTPVGRRMRAKALHRATPLIRTRPRDLEAAGIERVPRTIGVRKGRPLLEDGRTLDVANVVWCTGFHPAFSWVDLPVFDEKGDPRHERGVVGGEPGLYFVGLQFLYAMSSPMIQGVGRDARHIADRIAARLPIPVGDKSAA